MALRIVLVDDNELIRRLPRPCAATPAIRRWRRGRTAAAGPRVVGDVSGIAFSDSTGLRALIRAAREVRALALSPARYILGSRHHPRETNA